MSKTTDGHNTKSGAAEIMPGVRVPQTEQELHEVIRANSVRVPLAREAVERLKRTGRCGEYVDEDEDGQPVGGLE